MPYHASREGRATPFVSAFKVSTVHCATEPLPGENVIQLVCRALQAPRNGLGALIVVHIDPWSYNTSEQCVGSVYSGMLNSDERAPMNSSRQNER